MKLRSFTKKSINFNYLSYFKRKLIITNENILKSLKIGSSFHSSALRQDSFKDMLKKMQESPPTKEKGTEENANLGENQHVNIYGIVLLINILTYS